jgi:hypothetical protein
MNNLNRHKFYCNIAIGNFLFFCTVIIAGVSLTYIQGLMLLEKG